MYTSLHWLKRKRARSSIDALHGSGAMVSSTDPGAAPSVLAVETGTSVSVEQIYELEQKDVI